MSAYGAAQSKDAKAFEAERRRRQGVARSIALALAYVTLAATTLLVIWTGITVSLSRRIRRIRELLGSS